MRSLRQLCVRACALSFVVLGAALFAAPGCAIANLINSGKDCTASCDILKMCGVLHSGDCGAYCAGLVSGAVIAGCNDLFDAQNSCAKDNANCSSAASAATCAPQAAAFAKCMADFCKNHSSSPGCSQLGGGGDAGGGDSGASEAP